MCNEETVYVSVCYQYGTNHRLMYRCDQNLLLVAQFRWVSPVDEYRWTYYKDWRSDEMIHGYPSVYQIGHKAIIDIFSGEVVVQEKVDGCVSMDTLILKSDLTWIPARSITIGDELIGLVYEENRLRLDISIVTVATPIWKPCVRVTTDKQQIVCSKDHPFWVRKTSSNNTSKWCKAENIKIGYSIPYIPTWDTDRSWEAGYLAGQFDGEGSLVKHGKNQRTLSYYQRVSPSQQFVRELLIQKGFTLREDIRRRKDTWKEIWTGILAGGWGEILRFLGQIRPQRLLEKAKTCWIKGAINGLDKATVLSIEDVGNQQVMGLSTSTQTYWAGGLASHNSQLSFGKIDGELKMRSKGAQLIVDAPEKMFNKAVETVKELEPLLHPEWVYRGEYLAKPKHNTLAYSRVPKKNIILFDISIGNEIYLPYNEMKEEAERLGLEVVPIFYQGKIETLEFFRDLLETESILGGTKVEGVVVKNYFLITLEKKVAMGKYVSEMFQEVHKGEWRKSNPTDTDITNQLIVQYRTPARWHKAVQHLRDAGTLTDSPKDIGNIMKEVPADILKECEDEIKDKLFKHFWSKIARGVTHGVPEWYLDEMLKGSFNKEQT